MFPPDPMNSPPDNRAVSALFRVFGADEEFPAADDREFARCRGMHRGETAVLAVLVPLTVMVVAGDCLGNWMGPPAAWLLAAPVAFLLLNILPFLFLAKNQSLHWVMWLGACFAWAVFRLHADGVVGLLAYVWIAIAIVNLAAACLLDWRTMMGWSGKLGIAWRSFLLVAVHAALVFIGVKWGWHLAILTGSVVDLTWVYAILNPSSQALGPVYRTTDFEHVLITIDDGPDPHDTPVVLDLLDRYRANAIFFVIGEKARAHPELIREIVRRGHEIGNHTLTHPAGSFWCAGPWRTRREIAGCQDIVREITGTPPRWFRAPVGHRNFFTHPVATALGLRVMGWNRRGYDAVEKDPAKVLARILPGLAVGDIVLVHEATPIAAEVVGGVLDAVAGLADL